MKRWWLVWVVLAAFVLLSGCGGGGGGGSSSTGGTTDSFARPKVPITWSPRSKAVTAPSSALSAVILFRHASHAGQDVSYSVDRTGPVEGSTVVYTGTEEIKVAPTELTVRFYSQPGGAGVLVGAASGTVAISTDGAVPTPVVTQGTIASVEVPAGQVLTVGEHRTLDFGARDANHSLIAVSPGSATWTVSSGADKLSFSQGEATGLAVGSPEVTATVDGKSSGATVVSVTDPGAITVAVTPSSISLAPSGTQQFAAEVHGAANTTATWSIVEAGGGTISTSGFYTAPATSGAYTVKATSVANPAKFATATVAVQNIHVEVTPTSTIAARGGTVQFTATITGTANLGVTWSVVENGGGTVTSTGLYTAPNTAGTYTVRATSQANTAIFAQGTVSVQTGSFETIGRFRDSEAGLSTIIDLTAISADGSTVGGRALMNTDGPAYWTKSSGWVGLNTLGGPPSGRVQAISADGSALAGFSGPPAGGQPQISYYWTRAGSAERMRGQFQDTDLMPVAITADGRTAFGVTNRRVARWSPGSGLATSYSQLLNIFSCSADGSVLGGLVATPSSGGLWTEAGGLESIPGFGSFTYVSSDGQAAASIGGDTVFHWTRARGVVNVGTYNLLSASGNGKYLLLENAQGVFLWSEANGALPLGPILESVGAPADLSYRVPGFGAADFISEDGKTLVGLYHKDVGGVTASYVYYAHLPVAP